MTESTDQTSADDPGEAEPETEGTVGAALDDLPDGGGCAEIWDYLSDQRRRD